MASLTAFLADVHAVSSRKWGLLLYQALPVGTPGRSLADTVDDFELITPEGYILIMKKILLAHQAYIELELEKVVMGFLNLRQRVHSETYTAYVAYVATVEQLANHLDQQLLPAPPLDDGIKAILLLRAANLGFEQRTQLASKRAGIQSFDVAAGQLRLLDRPEVFLQQAKAPTETYIATSAPCVNGSVDPRLLVIEDTGQSRRAESLRSTAQRVRLRLRPWR